MVNSTGLRRRSARAPLLIALVAISSVVDVPTRPGLLAAGADTTSDVSLGAADPVTDGTTRYIVEVDGSLDAVVARQEDLGVEVVHEWDGAAAGFAAALTLADRSRLARDPAVSEIHVDQVIEISAVQPNAPWGLDRIDQRDPPLDATYNYDSTGAGVTAYVVDTGIRSTHVEFQGRVGDGAFVDFGDGRGVEDCNGHGTHVSGILGGTVSGVAKAATIVPVKVFNCSGSAFTSDVIAGLNWIIGDHLPGEPAVVNMSLGSPTAFEPLDAAVNAVIADGITVVVAAGNSAVSSCGVSPARVADAITVAAINSNDTRASYSNVGPCNDLFAPGSGIVSADIASDSSLATRSGTSMAAPHVAGAVARYLQTDPGATPTAVRTAIDASTDPGVTGRATGDPDKILYLGCVVDLTGMIAWWRGEDDLVAEVGPELAGTVPFATGRVGRAMDFGGPTQTNLVATSGLATLTDEFTFEAWIRPTITGQSQAIASRWSFLGGRNDDAYVLLIGPDGDVEIRTNDPSGRVAQRLRVPVHDIAALYDGSFHHIAATRDATTVAIYLDGTQRAALPTLGGSLNAAADTEFRLGSSTGRGNPFWYQGQLDEATIWRRALTASEINSIRALGANAKSTCIFTNTTGLVGP